MEKSSMKMVKLMKMCKVEKKLSFKSNKNQNLKNERK